MRFSSLRRDRLTGRFLTFMTASLLLWVPFARAQMSGSGDVMTPRADRPQISVSVRDGAGAAVTAACTVKLLLNGVLIDEAGLSHGHAFFQLGAYGSYTLVIDATGYKSAQRDLNVSVSMPYQVEISLEREGAGAEAAGPPKPLLTPKAKEALDKALKALSENKLPEAEKRVAEAVKLAPFHPDVLYVQGVLFLNRKDWAQAQSALEKASQMDPTNARAFAALGMALTDEGKYDAAIPPLEKSLQLDTGSYETHWALGKAYYHQQRYDQALKTSQLAWTESNGKAPQIELLVAETLTAVGKYEDAAQALRDFLQRYGNLPEASTARRWLDGLAKNGKIHSN